MSFEGEIVGEIFSVKKGYAFIDVDGYDRPVFCPFDEFDRPIDSTDIHTKVSIGHIGDNGRGPTCYDVTIGPRKTVVEDTGYIVTCSHRYGFIKRDSDGENIFFLHSQLPINFDMRDVDQHFVFEVASGLKGLNAFNLRII